MKNEKRHLLTEPLLVIINNKSIYVRDLNLAAAEIGQKALGLLNIPKNWRRPFFVIGKKEMSHYRHLNTAEKIEYCTKIAYAIADAAKSLFPEAVQIIIRSSGLQEGLYERGMYNTAPCKLDCGSILQHLHTMWEEHIQYTNEDIAYIVQENLTVSIKGHLSNERMVAQHSRDWRVEYEDSDEPMYSIGIRTWREHYEMRNIENSNLLCDTNSDIKASLRKVAFYFYKRYRKKRCHFEFLWTGKEIVLVQMDHENELNCVEDPTKYNIAVIQSPTMNMRYLREIDEKLDSKYRKVKNVFVYKKLGLFTVPIYILDDMTILRHIMNGFFSDEIASDFLQFGGQSIVIRTDVASSQSHVDTLLKRSNELRDLNSIKEWLIKNLCDLSDFDQIALLVHIFVPSLSSAFAYADPDTRIVSIQALWGLPEGLYYNSHDSYLMDVGSKWSNHIKEESIRIFQKTPRYKQFYYAPNYDGNWIQKRTKIPHDWRFSISDKQARVIAHGTKLIAQEAQSPISVMWFVGVDKNYYHSDCIPWYHEKFVGQTFNHATYKKKYYTDKEKHICCIQDLDSLDKDSSIRVIILQPKDDETLRDKYFISKVGEIAKKRDVRIYLEGTILAHPVYQLTSMGVPVILAEIDKDEIGRSIFYKLVRDNIPQNIIDNMESVKCCKVSGPFYFRYLKEKLVEESYEVFNSTHRHDLLEEFADAYEVITNLLNFVSNNNFYNLKREYILHIDNNKPNIVFNNISLLSKFESSVRQNDMTYILSLERDRHIIDLELLIGRGYERQLSETNPSSHQDRYVNLSFQILDSQHIGEMILLCKNYFSFINKDLESNGFTKDDLEQIRHQKNQKNGSFQKGYVLIDSKIPIKSQKNHEHNNQQMMFDFENESSFPEINYLPYNSIKYMDYRDTAHGDELIIRLSLPLCVDAWCGRVSGKNVHKMFGDKSYVFFSVLRERDIYNVKISVVREMGYQLSIDSLDNPEGFDPPRV